LSEFILVGSKLHDPLFRYTSDLVLLEGSNYKQRKVTVGFPQTRTNHDRPYHRIKILQCTLDGMGIFSTPGCSALSVPRTQNRTDGVVRSVGDERGKTHPLLVYDGSYDHCRCGLRILFAPEPLLITNEPLQNYCDGRVDGCWDGINIF